MWSELVLVVQAMSYWGFMMSSVQHTRQVCHGRTLGACAAHWTSRSKWFHVWLKCCDHTWPSPLFLMSSFSSALEWTYVCPALRLVRPMQDEVCRLVAADMTFYVCRPPVTATTSTHLQTHNCVDVIATTGGQPWVCSCNRRLSLRCMRATIGLDFFTLKLTMTLDQSLLSYSIYGGSFTPNLRNDCVP